MLKRKTPQKSLFQYVDPETLVPTHHVLRRIRQSVDLSFVTEEVKGLYSPDWGRPSLDPEVVLRMFLLGYLYNLSDRRLCDEVAMHAGFRWFCGLDFNDSVPDQSTLVKLRKKWDAGGIFERIMDRVVLQCIQAGLVDGSQVVVDGTQVTANAAIKSLAPIQPAVPLKEYLGRWDESSKGEENRDKGPKAPTPPAPPVSGRQGGDPDFHGEKFSNQTHRSSTDPDARLYRKGKGQEAKLRYLVHDMADPKSKVVLATAASQASSSAERGVALKLLDHVQALLKTQGRKVGELTADMGYAAGSFLAGVLELGVEPYVPLRSLNPEPIPAWKRPTFDLGRARKRKRRVREARARNRVRSHGAKLRRRHQRDRIRVEHVFAEAKNYHGLDRARSRGLEKVNLQALLTAITQNVKRLANWLGGRRGKAAAAAAMASLATLLTGISLRLEFLLT